MSRDVFDDLLTDVPPHVRVDPAPAWRRGRRRRTGARIGASAAVLVVLALLAAGFGLLPRSAEVEPADGSGGALGYPERIEHAYRIGDLAEAPGPVAGLLDSSTEGWLAVSPDGGLQRMPNDDPSRDVLPAVSADGVKVSYASHDGYVVQDLVSGVTAVARGLTPTAARTAYWSPDDAFVLVPVDGRTVRVAANGVATSVVVQQRGRWRPVGWLDARRIAWLPEDSVRLTRLLVTDADGAEPRVTRLDRPVPVGNEVWTAGVAPDGSAVDVVWDAGGAQARWSTYDVTTGAFHQAAPERVDALRCLPTWQRVGRFYSVGRLAAALPDGPSSTLLLDRGGRPLAVAYPGLVPGCMSWAAEALDGHVHRDLTAHLFGTAEGRAVWFWRELTVGFGLLVLCVVVGRRVLRARRGYRFTTSA